MKTIGMFASVLAMAVVLMVASWAQGANNDFQGTVNNNWSNSGNWSDGNVPDTTDTVRIEPAKSVTLTNSSTIFLLKMGDNWSGAQLTIDGGSLTVTQNDWSSFSYNRGSSTIITNGGSLTFTANHLVFVGFDDSVDGEVVDVTINSGSLTVGGTLKLGSNYDGSHICSAHVRVNGGVVTAGTLYIDNDNNLAGKGTVWMDIAGGTVIVNGDKRGDVTTWVGDGRMTAYGGDPNYEISAVYNGSSSTTIKAVRFTPELLSTWPEDDATDISTRVTLRAFFDEPIIKNSSGDIVIKNYATDVAVETIPVTDSKVSISGSTLIINPASTLSANTQYYVTMASGVVKDSDNYLCEAITDKNAWNFTTGAAPSATTVGYWRFDHDNKIAGQTAGMARDESGYGNDGSGVSFPTYSSSVFGSPVPKTGTGNAMSMDFERGSSQYIVVPDDNTLDIGGSSFTIEAYVKFETSPTDDNLQWIVNKRGGGTAAAMDYGVGFSGPGIYNYGAAVDGELVLARGKHQDDNCIGSGLICTDLTSWHYVSVAFDADAAANQVRFILDGQTAYKTFSRTAGPNTEYLSIGAEPGFRYFDGLIDEVRITKEFLPIEELLKTPPRGTLLIIR